MVERITASGDDWREYLDGIGGRLYHSAETLRQLLQEVIGRAVAAVTASEGSILVPDVDGRHLRFLLSHSPVADKLAPLRVPIEGSLVGCAFNSRQMMALGDLAGANAPAYYKAVDEQVGVATRTYLVVPLLLGSSALGVATYLNRPGEPPFQPFQTKEMECARAFASVQAVILRHLERTQHLDRLAAHELAQAQGRTTPSSPLLASAVDEDNVEEPWMRVLQGLNELSREQQHFCADFVAYLAGRRSGEVA